MRVRLNLGPAGKILRAGKAGQGAAPHGPRESDQLALLRAMTSGGGSNFVGFPPGSAWRPTGPQVRPLRQDENFRDWRADPQEFGHRQSLIPGGTQAGPFLRHPQAQDPGPKDDADARYPLPPNDRYPQALSQGYPVGNIEDTLVGRGQEGYNQGEVPQRIPRLWEDKLSHWEGLRTHGAGTVGLVAHNNHWLYMHHPIPSYPTRGYRSLSGVIAPQGPTASRARIPAVFVPSSVA